MVNAVWAVKHFKVPGAPDMPQLTAGTLMKNTLKIAIYSTS